MAFFSLERGPGIALQAMQEKKALISRGRGRLRGFLELRRPWGFSPEARRGSHPRSKHFLISWLQSPSAVILAPQGQPQ